MGKGGELLISSALDPSNLLRRAAAAKSAKSLWANTVGPKKPTSSKSFSGGSERDFWMCKWRPKWCEYVG